MRDVHIPKRRTDAALIGFINNFLDDHDPDRVASFSNSFDNF